VVNLPVAQPLCCRLVPLWPPSSTSFATWSTNPAPYAGQRLHHSANQSRIDPHYDVHDVCPKAAGQKRWRARTGARESLAAQPWTDHRAAISDRVRGEP
jgi:hypothetical protein